MTIVPFEPWHLMRISLQNSQVYMGSVLATGEYGEHVKKAGPCFTAMDGDEVIACAGLAIMWEGRAHAWALMSVNSGRRFVRIVRAIQRFLDMQDIRRIEAVVDEGFEQGHRMLMMLGFKLETPEPMRGFAPDGHACYQYARVK